MFEKITVFSMVPTNIGEFEWKL